MKKYGLIGFPLGHSFSKKFFTEKFKLEGRYDHAYELYELSSIQDFGQLLEEHSGLAGLNVTIPYKEDVIPMLDRLDEQTAGRIGAVNVIKFEEDGSLTGYNSDCIGFGVSLDGFIPSNNFKALVLGTGGASKAVTAALEDRKIPYQLVSRQKSTHTISYAEVTAEVLSDCHLVINTTPLGTYPNVTQCPNIPYEHLGEQHYCFDLVYNPEVTEFMRRSKEQGANIKNGLEMLYAQAEAAWEIWQQH